MRELYPKNQQRRTSYKSVDINELKYTNTFMILKYLQRVEDKQLVFFLSKMLQKLATHIFIY
jgi:hypothetical protein